MTNKSPSQLPEALEIADDDLILISQKQPDGTYISKHIKAALLKGRDGEDGVSITNVTVNEN